MKLAKIAKRLGLGVLVLAGVLVVRTLGGNSKQVEMATGAASPPLVIDADAVAARLGEAIRFRTVSSRDAEKFDRAPFAALLDWFEASYPAVYTGLRSERRADSSLLLHWPGSDPALPVGIFMAHLDVVPVEPGTEGDWTYPPFDGVVADGHIWGRGALDVKSSAVALHEAITLLLAYDFQPERGIWFVFGHDEEIGGAEGALPIAQWMHERGQKVAFVVDEGGFVLDGVFPELGGRPLAMVDIAEKGYATVHLSVRGEGGHSSVPPPSTSVGRMAAALAKLEQNPFPLEFSEPVRAQLEYLAPEMPFLKRMALANLWLFGGLVKKQLAADPSTNPMVRTTTAVTVMHGGVQENVVPQQASASVNFRMLPGTDEEDVLEHVRTVIDDESIELELGMVTHPPKPADIDGPHFAAIARAVRSVYRDAVVVPALLYGATDSRHYAGLTDNVYRFHGMRLPIEDVSGFHGTNERVQVVNYAKAIEILARMLLEMTGPSDGE
jgi:carboxypeptidase PM20D1